MLLRQLARLVVLVVSTKTTPSSQTSSLYLEAFIRLKQYFTFKSFTNFTSFEIPYNFLQLWRTCRNLEFDISNFYRWNVASDE
jgi:hypothetical protein